MTNEQEVVFNPQLWHYKQAEEVIQNLTAMFGYRTLTVDGVSTSPVFAQAASGETLSMADLASSEGDDAFDADEEFDEEGLQDFDGEGNHWKCIYLAVLHLDMSACALLCRQGCVNDGLRGAYLEWCTKADISEDESLSSLLQELHEARNCLCAHPKKLRFEVKNDGYRIIPASRRKGTSLDPFGLDVPRTIEYFRAVRELWYQVLHHRCGEDIPEDQEAPFRWEP